MLKRIVLYGPTESILNAVYEVINVNTITITKIEIIVLNEKVLVNGPKECVEHILWEVIHILNTKRIKFMVEHE